LNPDPVHAMVARCLVDPFPQGIMPAAPPSLSAEQYEQVRKVQAFIIKVKHNALRRVLPCTFRLLSLARLELRFFLSFASTYIAARRAGPLPVAQHLACLVPALETFLDQTDEPGCPLIREMLSHECALHGVSVRSEDCLQDGLVSWKGSCILMQRRFDVAAIAAQLERDPLSIELRHTGRRHHLLYQSRNLCETASVREVDMLTALIFRHSANAGSMTTLAANLSRMAACAIDEGMIGHALEQALHAGIVARINADLPQATV
jgi:hypothetical protein